MTSNDERGRDAEPAGEVSEAAAAGLPAGGESDVAAPAGRARRPRTRVFAEAVVAALSEEGEAGRGGGADGGDGAGA